MAGRVVVVTGVTRFLGSALAGLLAADPRVERVIGVDASQPDVAASERMGAAEFTRADIRNPLIARVLAATGADTVVHASASATPASSAARTLAKEMNVIGTMQLLAACQRSPHVKHLVVRSTTAVYGASPRDPAVFTETTEPKSVPSTGRARDAIDIEGYVRGFSRRRTDVRVAVPRLAEIVGPTVQTPLTRYFSLTPVVPTVMGMDARLQLLHEHDAVRVLEHLALSEHDGVVNVAGAGTMMLSQAVHRSGRVPLPVPRTALGMVARGMRTLRLGGFSPEQLQMLVAGRVVDTTRLRGELGFQPRYTTVGAFDDFAATLTPALPTSTVRQAEVTLAGLVGVAPREHDGSGGGRDE